MRSKRSGKLRFNHLSYTAPRRQSSRFHVVLSCASFMRCLRDAPSDCGLWLCQRYAARADYASYIDFEGFRSLIEEVIGDTLADNQHTG